MQRTCKSRRYLDRYKMDNPIINNCSYSYLDLDRLSLARGVSDIVAFLGCCSTLLIMLLYRAFRSTLQRLFLYLTVALTAHSAMSVMQIRSRDHVYCVTVVASMVVMLFTLYCVRLSSPSRRRKIMDPNHVTKRRRYCKVVVVISSL